MKALAAMLVPLVAGIGWALLSVVDAVRVWRGRRHVRAAVERETARHVGRLVPLQRPPTDPQPWWDFVLERDGDDR